MTSLLENGCGSWLAGIARLRILLEEVVRRVCWKRREVVGRSWWMKPQPSFGEPQATPAQLRPQHVFTLSGRFIVEIEARILKYYSPAMSYALPREVL